MGNNKTIHDEIKEYRAQFEKSMASIAAMQEKAQVEIEEIRARQKKTDEQQRKTDKQLKKAHKEFFGKWGRLVESLVEGELVKLLRGCEIDVHNTHCRLQASYPLGNGKRKEKEFDIVVANGSEVVAVEVKTTLTPDDVKRFVGAMREFSNYFPYWGSKTVYGAVAYIHRESEADVFAERQGLYVIRATGGSASIVNSNRFRPVSFSKPSPRSPKGHLRAVPAG